VISGTPSAGGSFSFTIRAVDSANNFGTQNYTVLVGSNSLTINPASLPNGTVLTGIIDSDGKRRHGGPYTYSITSGSLPNGLSLMLLQARSRARPLPAAPSPSTCMRWTAATISATAATPSTSAPIR